ncbi:MAG: hypothetical protein QNJ55_25510 [Xenococcus sp. MO_188.B8]|nr:hypothetical protein [Xenococcus sp. MO_188.B8]
MGKICIIGPRSSGKTTYLAGLAYWPDKQRQDKRSSRFEITAFGDAEKLKEKAENIICQGASLEPTDIKGGIDGAPLYQFRITIKHLLKKPDDIDLMVRDYPGEIFEELASGRSNSLHDEFLEECLKNVQGCLMLLADWTKEADKFYSQALKEFTKKLDKKGRLNDFRIAVAMSKCERGELWSGRLDPEIDIFDLHLPKTKNTLQSKILRQNLQFYAISTFGVLKRHDPRPNRKDKLGKDSSHAVLREAELWKPYNMIAPLYWLSEGKRIDANA